eukprot:293979-Ditylum_brightwellii.AAC.1
MSVAASIHGNVVNSCTKKSVITIDDSRSDDEDVINEDEDSTDAIEHNSRAVQKENDAVSTDEEEIYLLLIQLLQDVVPTNHLHVEHLYLILQ